MKWAPEISNDPGETSQQQGTSYFIGKYRICFEIRNMPMSIRRVILYTVKEEIKIAANIMFLVLPRL